MENLGRGVVAVRSSNTEIFVSWRLLGTEPSDLAFNIYRTANDGPAVKLNSQLLTKGTNWVDATANMTQSNSYFVKAVKNNVEEQASLAFKVDANTPVQPFYKIPIQKTTDYYVLHAKVGDVDGDGEYDYIVYKDPKTDQTKPQLIEAYKRDGTFLWQINLGPNSVDRDNILPGSAAINIGHADNVTIYDINNDGKAELILRTANGVKFGDGQILTEANNNKQFISVINGLTGAEISRTLYNNPHIDRGPMSSHMAIAYLDGINPSVIWDAKNRNADDSFNEYTTAWDWKNGTLVQKWQTRRPEGAMKGHQIRCADVDGDGKDEIIPQGLVIDDDGSILYSLGDNDIFHGDRFFVSDLDPKRPGLEMYGIQQGYSVSGIMWYYVDAKTGEVLLSQNNPANLDLGRGYVGDLDPRYDGYELYTFVDGLYNVSGQKTTSKLPSSYPNLRLWWDGDLGSELLDGNKFTKWNYLREGEDRLHTASGVLLAPRNVPAYYGDIMGDWREEVIYASSDDSFLVIYTTPHPTEHRIYTLPHNPQYRNDMTAKGYDQSFMTSYYLGFNMEQPPTPPIQIANKYWKGTQNNIWDDFTNNWENNQNLPDKFENQDILMFDIRGNNTDTVKLSSNFSPKKIWFNNPQGKDYNLAGNGVLTGAIDIVKTLEGTVSIKGNHLYTGKTVIEEGTFIIDGTFKNEFVVTARGNLGGKGNLEGSVTLNSAMNINGGGLKPGLGNALNEIGTLKILGNLSIPGNNNLHFDIFSGTTVKNDSILVTGNLIVNGVNTLIVSFKDNLIIPGTYTLLRSQTALTATKENFVIEGIVGVPKEVIVEGNEVKIRILTQRTPNLVYWKGAEDNFWNFEKQNFSINNTSTSYVSKDEVIFDYAASRKEIILSESVFTNGLNFQSGNYNILGAGSIGGIGSLKKADSVSLNILLNKNTYSGKNEIGSGSLTIANLGLVGKPSSLGFGSKNPADFTLNNTLLTITEDSYSDRGVTLSGNNTIHIPTQKYSILSGDIIGSGQIIKTGAGGLYLIGKNNFTGTTLVKEGTVNLRKKDGNEAGLGLGTITLENATLNLEDVRESAQINWDLIIPEGKNAFLTTDGRSSMRGKLTGSGTLNIKNPYVRTDYYGDWSQFTGNLILSGSDFRIANNKGYPNASINVAEGTLYTISGSSNLATLGDLSGAEGAKLSGATWTIGTKNTDATFAGTISGNSINKVGTGTWIVTGNNTLTGAVNISGGRVLVNNVGNKRGLGSGVVTVESGAILGGIGSVKGAVVFKDGAILQPGNNNIGVFTDSTSVQLSANSITEIEINKNSFSNDKVKVIGSITLGGKLVIKNLAGQSFAEGDSYTLFEANSYSGNFNQIEPLIPGEGLLWEFVYTTGVLKVIKDPNAVLVLPAKNFTVSVSDETCNTSNNGKITIKAEAAYNYIAFLNGDKTKPYTFNNKNLEIANLNAGTYNVCITIADEPNYEQCFELLIKQPEALNVLSSVSYDNKLVTLNLNGAAVYHVSVNGKITTTTANSITLDLLDTENNIKVSTDKECQGTYTTSIHLNKDISVYPNPFNKYLSVEIKNLNVNKATVKIYSLTGLQIYSQQKDVIEGIVYLDLQDLNNGVYVLEIETGLNKYTAKIIKNEK